MVSPALIRKETGGCWRGDSSNAADRDDASLGAVHDAQKPLPKGLLGKRRIRGCPGREERHSVYPPRCSRPCVARRGG